MGTHPIFESDFDCLTDESEMRCPNYTVHHGVAFFSTFVTYAFFHAARKTLSNSKDSISLFWTENEFNKTNPSPHETKEWERESLADSYEQAAIYLGTLDTVFMICYSIGLFVSGYLGENYSQRLVLSLGTLLNAISLFIFGCVLPWMNCTSFYIWVFVWAINGFSQSTGWPSVVTVMGNWYSQAGRGLVMGVWSSCQSIGNILGALMVNWFLPYGFQYSFMFISYCLLLISVMVFFSIVDHPKDVGMVDEDLTAEEDQAPIVENDFLENGEEAEEDEELTRANNSADGEKPQFLRVLALPGVLPYSISFFALKLVNYSFFFWLPYFLHNKYHWSDETANFLSTWFDVGGIVGGTLGGILSDLWGRRSPVVFLMTALAVPSLFMFNESPDNQTAAASLMCLSGFFIGGASNMIGAACAADLGKTAIEYGLPSAVSLVTGIIDGTGSVGAAVGQVTIPFLELNYGWGSVFLMFMVMCSISAVALLPVVVRELRNGCCKLTSSQQTTTATYESETDELNDNQ